MMVIWFSFIVGSVLLVTGAAIAFVEIRNPEADTQGATDTLFTAITIILGALLGMLSVKGAATSDLARRPGEETPTDVTERVE
jgi:hypothetical protein